MNLGALAVVIRPLQSLWPSSFLKWSWEQGTGNEELGPWCLCDVLPPTRRCASNMSFWKLTRHWCAWSQPGWELKSKWLMGMWNGEPEKSNEWTQNRKTLPRSLEGAMQEGGQSLSFGGFSLDTSPDWMESQLPCKPCFRSILLGWPSAVALPFLRPQVNHRRFAGPWALSPLHLRSVWKEWVSLPGKVWRAWGWDLPETDPAPWPQLLSEHSRGPLAAAN